MSDKYSEFSDDKIRDEIKKLKNKISQKGSTQKKKELEQKIRDAENSDDEKLAGELLAEYQKLLAD